MQAGAITPGFAFVETNILRKCGKEGVARVILESKRSRLPSPVEIAKPRLISKKRLKLHLEIMKRVSSKCNFTVVTAKQQIKLHAAQVCAAYLQQGDQWKVHGRLIFRHSF